MGGYQAFLKEAVEVYQQRRAALEGDGDDEDSDGDSDANDGSLLFMCAHGCWVARASLCGSGARGDMDSKLQSALMAVLGKAKKEMVPVDLSSMLRQQGLDLYFPTEAWPPTAAVRELATKIKTLEKGGGSANPYVYCDLKKCVFPCMWCRLVLCVRCSCRFLPPFCPEHLPVVLSLEDEKGADDKETKKKASTRRLEVAAWMLAWDRYSLGAAALEQMSFYTAMRHKTVVAEVGSKLPLTSGPLCVLLQVAVQAVAEGRRPLWGVLYDELARLFHVVAPVLSGSVLISRLRRKHWEDLSGKLGSGFIIEKQAGWLADGRRFEACEGAS